MPRLPESRWWWFPLSHSSLFPSLLHSDGTLQLMSILPHVSLLVRWAFSPFVLLDALFTLAAASKRSVSCICTTQAPLPSSRVSAVEMREHSGHYSPPCVCVCTSFLGSIWVPTVSQQVKQPSCPATALTGSRNTFPSSCPFRPKSANGLLFLVTECLTIPRWSP